MMKPVLLSFLLLAAVAIGYLYFGPEGVYGKGAGRVPEIYIGSHMIRKGFDPYNNPEDMARILRVNDSMGNELPRSMWKDALKGKRFSVTYVLPDEDGSKTYSSK